jgi:predicted DNA-binding WGR domain protein
VEGTSSKFWEVSQTGADMTTRWGRIGSTGQSKTKSFADVAAAARQVAKLIAEKTGEGYVEKTKS